MGRLHAGEDGRTAVHPQAPNHRHYRKCLQFSLENLLEPTTPPTSTKARLGRLWTTWRTPRTTGDRLRIGSDTHMQHHEGKRLCYAETFPESKTLTAQTFQTALITGAWDLFHGIWEYRNGILHDDVENINIDKMNTRICQLYSQPNEYVRPSSLCLFEAFTQDECIALPATIKQTWLRSIYLAIKAKHGDLKCLDDQSQTSLTDFFH